MTTETDILLEIPVEEAKAMAGDLARAADLLVQISDQDAQGAASDLQAILRRFNSALTQSELGNPKFGEVVTINEDGPVYYEPWMDE